MEKNTAIKASRLMILVKATASHAAPPAARRAATNPVLRSLPHQVVQRVVFDLTVVMGCDGDSLSVVNLYTGFMGRLSASDDNFTFLDFLF